MTRNFMTNGKRILHRTGNSLDISFKVTVCLICLWKCVLILNDSNTCMKQNHRHFFFFLRKHVQLMPHRHLSLFSCLSCLPGHHDCWNILAMWKKKHEIQSRSLQVVSHVDSCHVTIQKWQMELKPRNSVWLEMCKLAVLCFNSQFFQKVSFVAFLWLSN